MRCYTCQKDLLGKTAIAANSPVNSDYRLPDIVSDSAFDVPDITSMDIDDRDLFPDAKNHDYLFCAPPNGSEDPDNSECFVKSRDELGSSLRYAFVKIGPGKK